MADNVVVDIGEEVIRFAHDQGHVKASKDTINWSGVGTKCGKVKFEKSHYSKTSRTISVGSNEYQDVLDKLVVKMGENNEDNVVTAVEYDLHKDVSKASGLKSSGHGVCVADDCLINLTGKPTTCYVSFSSNMKKTCQAGVQLTHTLQCATNANPSMTRRNSDNVLFKKERTNLHNSGGNKNLSKILLSPKFRTSIHLPGVTRKTIVIPFTNNPKIKAEMPPGLKVPIEITETIEEEKGSLSADYFIWGCVMVTVWGKPYKLTLADILDPKNNSLFTRDNIRLNKKFNINSTDTEQAVKFEIKGVYESKKIHYNIKLNFPNTLLRRPINNVVALKCKCDTIQLPYNIQDDGYCELSNKNLAKIILRWRQIQYSFRDNHTKRDNSLLWKVIKSSDTELAKFARTTEIDKCCTSSTAVDKFLLSLILWREECETINELADLKWENVNKQAKHLTQQLFKLGMPVPVINFLWDQESQNEALQCPVHKFLPAKIPEPKCLKNSAQIKMKSQLPDRVLNRLSQRWDLQDGWVSTALFLGVDLHNVHRLATSDDSYNTVADKIMMCFKLWRIQHRRNSIGGNDGKGAWCSIWDLCEQLSEMGTQEEVFNFLWLDSETTP
uniref:uncharacterized protein LOC108950063 n=1 Tax=Ciona intestinalis TaxID=7719 RepID=UPI00089DB7E9|nr:uncharacterized protein LOC108950063 [Ciona intestinalis]|eukprot:XP_018670313.1 uncharacterized protein LOC108950063 [Ciona intestinalis]